ncbi:MAG: ABC transporter ATP-binding protein [Dehalococcoidia bacterium]|nr:ABC transporter ATP-binding protein [Dehalococcoidia bacterium]
MAAIVAQGLTKRYGETVGIEGLDLEVPEGVIFGFLGPNGAGKTTTIRLLTGFIKPTAGAATVLGADAWSGVQARSRLGFLPDVGGLYEEQTGQELLDFLGSLQGRACPLRASLCERLELPAALLRRGIKTYSKGSRRKLGLVQALQHDPDLLILDEPTEGLDPLMQQALFSILEETRARGRTVFMSSHILPEVERLCDQVAIVRGGHLVAVERVAELQRRKLRRLELRFRDGIPDAALALPGTVLLERRDAEGWVALEVRGPIQPLLRALAPLTVEDLVFEQAHLEEIFLDYYQQRGQP